MNHLKDNTTKSAAAEFFSYSLPAIVGMVLTAGIVIVDGLFIGRCVGSRGLAAVNLTLPVFYLFLGTATMIAVGGAVRAVHALGAGERTRADQAFSFTMAALLATVLLMLALVLLFFSPLLRLIRAEGELAGMARAYLGVIRWFYPLSMMQIGLSVFMRMEGKPQLPVLYGLGGNLLNLLLDYLFIFRFGWSLQGAALASGIAVTVPFILGVLHFRGPASRFRFVRPRWNPAALGEIFFNGSSEMAGQISVALSTWLFNFVILRRIGVEGVAAFTIAGYLVFVQGMIITGFTIGLAPLVGFSWGAKNYPRILSLLKAALAAGFLVGLLAWLGVLAGGTAAAELFSRGNPAVKAIADSAYGLFTAAFLLNGFNQLTAAFFTALGRAKASLAIALLRGFVFNVIALLTLPRLLGDMGIWLSFPLAEGLCAAAAAFLLFRWLRQYRRL